MDKTDIFINMENSYEIDCRIVDYPEQCKKSIGRHNFKLLTCNIRSIRANFAKLLITLKRLDMVYDAIVLTECWVHGDSYFPQLEDYNVFHTTKVIKKSSGVTVYIRDCWPASAVEPVFHDADCLIIKLNKSITIVGIYRTPSITDTTRFLESLDEVLESLEKTQTLIVTGDMNINLLDETPDSSCAEYKDLIAEHSLIPAITKPTRGQNCLDHILIKSKNTSVTGLTIKAPLTDHSVIMTGINTKNKKSTEKNRSRQHIDFKAVEKELKATNWGVFTQINCVNEAVNTLNKLISGAVSKHSHKGKISRTKLNIKPWVTPGLVRCMRLRDTLHLQTKKQPHNEILKISYTRYKNYCNDILRKVKWKYENDQLSKNYNNPKKMWKTIKNICDIPAIKNHAHVLLQNANSPKEAVNRCNRHFNQIGSKLADDILQKLGTTENDLCKALRAETRCQNSLFLSPTDLYEVNSIINNLKPDSAPGIDTFSSILLKSIKSSILVPLVHICNLSMSTGIFPEIWKTAVVTPIHKSGPKDDADNYRPISLLCILGKVLEKIVNHRLVSFLEKHDLLSALQFGFRRGKSTEDAVQLLVETVSSQLDTGKRALAVYLDLAKAFDTVSIPIMLKKLDSMGVRGTAQDWFASYLKDRKQRVKINDCLSEECCLSFGVPQGGILSPTLFTIYMDELLKQNIPNAKLICYADDTVAIFHGKNWDHAVLAAERGMSRIAWWLDQNLLTLNVKKTHFIGFHITRATEPTVSHIKIHSQSCHLMKVTLFKLEKTCACRKIERVDNTRYLGIQIDQNLTFELHISNLAKRVRKIIHVMKQLRNAASETVRSLVYVTLCQSILQYCIGVWGGAAKSFMIEVERAQRAVLKVMLGKPRRYDTDKLYQEADQLSVRQLFIMKAVSKVHNVTPKSPLRKVRPVAAAYPRVRTVFARRLPKYIHIFTYNSVSKLCDLKQICHRKARGKVKSWLKARSYAETEAIVKVYDPTMPY